MALEGTYSRALEALKTCIHAASNVAQGLPVTEDEEEEGVGGDKD